MEEFLKVLFSGCEYQLFQYYLLEIKLFLHCIDFVPSSKVGLVFLRDLEWSVYVEGLGVTVKERHRGIFVPY